ncbi:MAG: ribonuclease [Oscillospiraceae bacterium]|nr:ribonuclease [Oscillospiraceae bacterium]
MTMPALTLAPEVVTQIVTVTEVVTVTEIVTVIAETPDDPYDAGALTETGPLTTEGKIDKDGVYTTKDDVALYIYTYGELPKNFITKKEAQKLGWEGGSLEPYAPGCCIGGSYFGNYEGSLPEKAGREYTECDIDTLGKKSRGAKRIVFSNDGLIYYTGDHYKTFELLYGEE